MKLKLPEGFDLLVNLKQAAMNAAGLVLCAYLFLSITQPWVLITIGIFGFCGGSLNDIVGWRRNKDAIMAQTENK